MPDADAILTGALNFAARFDDPAVRRMLGYVPSPPFTPRPLLPRLYPVTNFIGAARAGATPAAASLVDRLIDAATRLHWWQSYVPEDFGEAFLTRYGFVELLERLTRDQGLALLLISHDLRVVESVVGRVIVMYAGRVIEEGPTAAVFSAPLHPYTKMLLASAPGRRGRLDDSVQDPATSFARPVVRGCRFSHRCPIAEPTCHEEEPELLSAGPGRRVRCPLAEPIGGESSG